MMEFLLATFLFFGLDEDLMEKYASKVDLDLVILSMRCVGKGE